MKTLPLPATRRAARLSAVLLPLLVLSAACNRSAPASEATLPERSDAAKRSDAATEARSARFVYVCPMHPHIRLHAPGNCPICGMTLVQQDLTPAPPAPAENTREPPDGTRPAGASTDRKVLYYYDPMRPDVHFDQPGKSPFMDMQLLPKYAEPAADRSAANPGVSVRADVVQHLGIRIAQAVRRDLRPSVRVPARVVADARGQARLQARVDGWIERLIVRAPGQSVSAGSPIAEIYAPDLVQAQEEMLLGAETAGPAAERLRRLGIAEQDIQAIRRAGHALRRLPLRAPVGGVITGLGVREGSRVTPDALIADISGKNSVWIEAQLFPAQSLALGDRVSARFTVPGLPGRAWHGEAGAAVPVADAATQTQAMRFAVATDGALPLGMVLDGELHGALRSNVLVVPVSAVIRTAQGDRVLRAYGANRFVPTPVTIGERQGDLVEIVDGLAESDRIVASGQFLLDAEANLGAGLAQMGGPSP